MNVVNDIEQILRDDLNLAKRAAGSLAAELSKLEAQGSQIFKTIAHALPSLDWQVLFRAAVKIFKLLKAA